NSIIAVPSGNGINDSSGPLTVSGCIISVNGRGNGINSDIHGDETVTGTTIRLTGNTISVPAIGNGNSSGVAGNLVLIGCNIVLNGIDSSGERSTVAGTVTIRNTAITVSG